METNKTSDSSSSKIYIKTIIIEENQQGQSNKYIFIDHGKHISTITVDEIICALAKGNYTYIFLTGGKKYVVRKLLKEITEMLPKENFLRIHRSTCVNLNFIEDIKKVSGGSYSVRLKSYPEILTISRRYVHDLKEKFIQ